MATGGQTGQRVYSNTENPEGDNSAALSALFILQDAATGTDNGQWVQFYPFRRATLEVESTGGATYSVQLYGSCHEAKPANSYDGFAIGSAVATDGQASVDSPVRWVKAKVGTFTGGTNPKLTVRLNCSTG